MRSEVITPALRPKDHVRKQNCKTKTAKQKNLYLNICPCALLAGRNNEGVTILAFFLRR